MNQDQNRQLVQQLQNASQKLTQTSDQQEQMHLVGQIRSYTDALSSGTRSSRSKTIFSIEASVPDSSSFHRIQQQLEQTTAGIKEVSYRVEGSTPRVRIQASREALPNIDRVLQEVGRGVREAWGSEQS